MKLEVTLVVLCCGSGWGWLYPRLEIGPLEGNNTGSPLFLTPYIEAGRTAEARIQAKVKPLKSNVTSFAGFLTVDKRFNSNMFFWYFPSERESEKAPVVVWLQGGPGATSLFGLFNEIGPFYVKNKRGLKMRQYYWSQVVNLIFIDNPVGTGFSFTDKDSGYSNNEVDVGNNLYSVVSQFFQLFPELKSNDFFVAGESYAGKYVPALAYTIHIKNPKAANKINLKGIAIGNGLCAPEFMASGYGDYLYQIGLIDSSARFQFQSKEKSISDLIKKQRWTDAFDVFDSMLNGDMTPYKSLFYNTTGFEFYFNMLYNKDYSYYGNISRYIQMDLFRRSVHVGNLTFHTDTRVEEHLKSDIMQSVKPWVEKLLEKYRVLIYNGQLDIIVAYPLTMNFVQNLNWSGSQLYKIAKRKPWMVGNDLAGYSKTAKGFTEVLVRDAGHMVPMDQPLWALDLISRFVLNKGF